MTPGAIRGLNIFKILNKLENVDSWLNIVNDVQSGFLFDLNLMNFLKF